MKYAVSFAAKTVFSETWIALSNIMNCGTREG
jgi:hypothetical protein